MTSLIEKPAMTAGLPAESTESPFSANHSAGPSSKRAVDEWIGANPDSAIPSYVKRRILDRYDWKCYLTKINLRPLSDQVDFDHIRALCNGGEHREKNLAPIWRPKHREKTAADISERAATDRKIAHHYGLESKKPAIAKRPKKERIVSRPPLPRRPLYEDIA